MSRPGRLPPSSLVVASLLLGALSPGRGRAEEAAPPMGQVERTAYLMGTRVRLMAEATGREAGMRLLEGLLVRLEAAEAELSTWQPESRLSRLNRHPVDQPFPLPAGLCSLFASLFHWTELTGSAFDPAIGSLVEVWDLRGRGRVPTLPETHQALARAGLLRSYAFDPSGCRITRRRPVLLDAGAFGKGAALDGALQWAERHGRGPWLVDLGGQIAVGGEAGSGWSISLAHPLARGEPVLEVKMGRGSLATSGGSERDLVADGNRITHILDPRTGRGAAFDGSVSVWHESALAADILSTALFVMGPGEGLRWAEERGIQACFLVPVAGAPELRPEVLASPSFRSAFLEE